MNHNSLDSLVKDAAEIIIDVSTRYSEIRSMILKLREEDYSNDQKWNEIKDKAESLIFKCDDSMTLISSILSKCESNYKLIPELRESFHLSRLVRDLCDEIVELE